LQQKTTFTIFGDVSLGPVQQTEELLHRLNGKIHLIKGNHETSALANKWRFEWVRDVYELYIPEHKQAIFMSHYAHRVWNKSHHGVWHLYGHSHGTLPDDPESNSFDCGVDCHNYAPLSYEEVAKIISKKTPKAKDHHGK
jgi:calcineurin-like phosphoesterase family protein